MTHELLRRVAAAVLAGDRSSLWIFDPGLKHWVYLGQAVADLLRDRDELAARVEDALACADRGGGVG